jgi:hypothetical protein
METSSLPRSGEPKADDDLDSNSVMINFPAKIAIMRA